MRAVILAAGRGSRLGPLSASRPKGLVEIDGISLIERQIATLRAGGVTEIALVGGYRADMLDFPGVRRFVNPAWESTNMVESLFAAEDFFGDDLIVSYGDIVYEPRILRRLLDAPFEVSVIVDRNWRALWEWRFADPLDDAESLRMDEEGQITDIGNPVDDIETIEAQYTGLMRFKGQGVDALRTAKQHLGAVARAWMDKRPVAQAYMTDLLMELILRGNPPHAIVIEGGWLEVDTISDVERIAAAHADGTLAQFFDPAQTPSRKPNHA